MLKLNKSTRHALHAALELARAERDQPVIASGVAERYNIPGPALAKVFQRLVHAGIAVGIRGSKGGYMLARAPSEVTLLQVIEAIEGAESEILETGDGGLDQEGALRLQRVFREVDEIARTTFASITLQTVLGVRRPLERPQERSRGNISPDR